MDDFDMNKLTCTIELILYKSLKENADDSYSHKLIDLVDLVKPRLSLKDLDELMAVLGKALNHEAAVDHIDLATAFKLLGTLVSDERVIQERSHSVEVSFGWIIQFENILKDQTDPHYDLQFSFLKCINKLCTTEPGCRLLASKEDLLLIIFHLLTQSQGFYVQTEAQSVITTLLTNILSQPGIVSHRLLPYLHQMLLVDCKSHMECLNNLVRVPKMRKFLITQFHLDSILISKLETTLKQDTLLSLLCETLASCQLSKESIQAIVQTLLEARKFNSIVTLYTQLVQSQGPQHIGSWKLFTIYPLVHMNAELSNQLGADEILKSSIISDLNANRIIFCLRSINQQIANSFNFEEKLFLFRSMGHFLNSAQTTRYSRKILSEAIQRFNLLSKIADGNLHLIRESLQILLQLVGDPFWNLVNLRSLLFEIFKMVRETVDRNPEVLSAPMILKISERINEMLTSISSSEENFDLIDSLLEILIVNLSHNTEQVIDLCPDLIGNFLDHWTKHYHESNVSSLISTCIPILLCIDFYSSADQLATFGLVKHSTIPTLLTSFMDEGEYLLRDSVIRSLRLHISSFITSRLWNDVAAQVFTRYYGLPMSQLILSEIDSELLSAILQVWIAICESVNRKTDPEKRSGLIRMLYESGVFTSLYLLTKDDFIVETIRTQAVNSSSKVSSLIISLGLASNDLISIFKGSVEPEFQIRVKKDNSEETGPADRLPREQIIDDIFKEHATSPTQDIINVVTEKITGSKNLTKVKRDIGQVSIDSIVNLFTNPIEDAGDSINPEDDSQRLTILDDIISARSFDTKIPSDCY